LKKANGLGKKKGMVLKHFNFYQKLRNVPAHGGIKCFDFSMNPMLPIPRFVPITDIKKNILRRKKYISVFIKSPIH